MVELPPSPPCRATVAGGTTTATKYYFFNGQRIAQRVGDILTYLHADHLGSTVLTTGVAGSAKYHAYGSTRSSGTVQTKYQFTGQEADSGTGPIYMQARYYDPVIGQFISPDTVVPDPMNVYAYNRYMYAYGNPLKLSDPSGHCATLGDGSPDMEGDSQCWQTAFSIFGAANSPYTSFAKDWRITPEQWLKDVAANPFFEADFLQPFADKYTAEHARGAGLSIDKVIWHEPPPFEMPELVVRFGSLVFAVCDIWDCAAIGLTATSLGISVAQTAAASCTIATGPLCGSAASYLTGADFAVNAVSFGKDVVDYAQGTASGADLAVSLADLSHPVVHTAVSAVLRTASSIPVVGIGVDAGMLLWEIAVPFIPNEQWGGVRSAH